MDQGMLQGSRNRVKEKYIPWILLLVQSLFLPPLKILLVKKVFLRMLRVWVSEKYHWIATLDNHLGFLGNTTQKGFME
jgi:hypothetical protein